MSERQIFVKGRGWVREDILAEEKKVEFKMPTFLPPQNALTNIPATMEAISMLARTKLIKNHDIQEIPKAVD